MRPPFAALAATGSGAFGRHSTSPVAKGVTRDAVRALLCRNVGGHGGRSIGNGSRVAAHEAPGVVAARAESLTHVNGSSGLGRRSAGERPVCAVPRAVTP